MLAIRRGASSADTFPQDLEGQACLGRLQPGKFAQAVSGIDLNVRIWIFRSVGLPHAFASHFPPTNLMDALKVYRDIFQRSPKLQQPYTMAGVNVIAAVTDEEATRLLLLISSGRPTWFEGSAVF